MTQEELSNILIWVFSVGIPASIAAIARIMRRQNENRANIAKQGKQAEEIKSDTDKRFEDLISTLGVLQQKIDGQEVEIRGLNVSYETLQQEHVKLKGQLEEKEKELQAQITENKRVSTLLEDERKSFTSLGAQYSELEDRYRVLERRVSEMNVQMEKQAAIIETYNRIIPLINTLPTQEKRTTGEHKKAVGE